MLRAAAPGENVLHAGEDVEAGQEILPAGTLLRPAEIGGLMALGIMQVPVAPRPRLAILSSGDEVVPPRTSFPRPGRCAMSTAIRLAALVEAARRRGPRATASSPTARKRCERPGCEPRWRNASMVVITAGSSASSRDLTAEAIAQLGAPGVLVHGVNVKPGKPTILGVCGGKAVIGLPGNPVSALVIAGLFVVPVIERLLGLPAGETACRRGGPAWRSTCPRRPGARIASRCSCAPTRGGRLAAEPIFYKSNLIFTLARADGLLHIPADANGLAAGEMV